MAQIPETDDDNMSIATVIDLNERLLMDDNVVDIEGGSKRVIFEFLEKNINF